MDPCREPEAARNVDGPPAGWACQQSPRPFRHLCAGQTAVFVLRLIVGEVLSQDPALTSEDALRLRLQQLDIRAALALGPNPLNGDASLQHAFPAACSHLQQTVDAHGDMPLRTLFAGCDSCADLFPVSAPDAAVAAASARAAADAAAAELLAAEVRESEARRAKAAAKAAKQQRRKERQRQAAAAAGPPSRAAGLLPLPLPLHPVDLNAGGGSPAPPSLARKVCRGFGSPASAAVPSAATSQAGSLAPTLASAAPALLHAAPVTPGAIDDDADALLAQLLGLPCGSPASSPPAVDAQRQRGSGLCGAVASAPAAAPTATAAEDGEDVDSLLGQLLGLSCGSPGSSPAAAAVRHKSLAPLPPHLASSTRAPAPASSGGAAACSSQAPADCPRPPEDLCCPITQELLRDPVLAADGFTYERSAIAAWLARQAAAGQPARSPMTGAPLAHAQLTANRLARSLVAALGAGANL